MFFFSYIRILFLSYFLGLTDFFGGYYVILCYVKYRCFETKIFNRLFYVSDHWTGLFLGGGGSPGSKHFLTRGKILIFILFIKLIFFIYYYIYNCCPFIRHRIQNSLCFNIFFASRSWCQEQVSCFDPPPPTT